MQEPHKEMYLEVCTATADACDLLSVAYAPLSQMEDSPEKQQLATILRTVNQRLKQSLEKAEDILLSHTDPA
ncbi:MAG: hypothetical protein FWD99_06380 [Oscillospiraceae bacterium]|nr:hypothetical protein [Oscillospiraceae bacterium]